MNGSRMLCTEGQRVLHGLVWCLNGCYQDRSLLHGSKVPYCAWTDGFDQVRQVRVELLHAHPTPTYGADNWYRVVTKLVIALLPRTYNK